MMFSTNWLKNSVPSVSWFTATAGRPSRTMSGNRNHREMSCGATVPKNPACVPGLLLTRKAALSGVSECFSFRSFFKRSRPTKAFIKMRRARGDAPVCWATSSAVLELFTNASKILLLTAAPMMSGGPYAKLISIKRSGVTCFFRRVFLAILDLRF